MEEDEVETSSPTVPNTAAAAAAATASATASATATAAAAPDEANCRAEGENPQPGSGPPAGEGGTLQGGNNSGFIFPTGSAIFGIANENRCGSQITKPQVNAYGAGFKRIFGTTQHCGPSRSSGSSIGSPARAAQKTAGFPPVYNVIRAAKTKALGARVLGGNVAWAGGAMGGGCPWLGKLWKTWAMARGVWNCLGMAGPLLPKTTIVLKKE